ncbi:MAG: adenylate/guanylate cyclase domain-containing protein, partial [Desulfatiglandales bacterium]
PKCQSGNPEGMKFCGECGAKLEKICPECNFSNPPNFKFCGECGFHLRKPKEVPPKDDSELEPPLPKPPPKEIPTTPRAIEGERKQVTALFSDMSGYTALSERLDPEEVKEITGRIFGEISRIVAKYDGFIEKFIGDAVMALFGVPLAHEDDPVMAIRAAREIHDLVQAISPELEEKIGKPLSMHTGINTGLVVTGEVDVEKGTHGVAGDTINVAARLSSEAGEDEILVGLDTYRRAEGLFSFETLDPTTVKGKTKPIQVYKLLSPKERSLTIRRLSGLRADLIGRKAEIAQLGEAVENLRNGKGRIFSISGDAGTGKSRLVEEFKTTLNLEKIQWLEGHAYAYAQNIPYFPLIDLLSEVFQIEEGDPPERIRDKLESSIEQLMGKKEEVAPYVGSLYALSYSEAEKIGPEFWKSRLQSAVQAIFSALARRAPTVFYLEDLHWADPSFAELLRLTLLEVRQPAIVLCVYRPPFSLFTSHQLRSIGKFYQEIRLQDLSPSEAQDMLESLLETDTIPTHLKQFVQEKAEGNPFYMEELINSLIESETLIRDDGRWTVTKPITESDISSTIHGVISGRLDRLEAESKRILQEASVIGKAFLYEILRKATNLKQEVDRCLRGLEQLDLIRTKALQPDLEYMFKQTLTQEVVYNGLLKKERQTIHEQIALVMEQVFQDRLPEFYETLAYHFARGRSVIKAVDYLVKSGEKSLARYSVEEAHQYFKQAFDILASKREKTKEEKIALIDIFSSWGYAYYYLGDFKTFVHLFRSHQDLAESLDEKARLGMFYAWLGIALWMSGRTKESHEILSRALDLGEESDNQKVIGYACTWLTWAYAEMGLFEESEAFGERAQEIAKLFPTDHYLFFKSLAGLGFLSWMKGDTKKLFERAKGLLDYGERYANSRSKVMGHWINSLGHSLVGDMESVKESSQSAVDVSEDPLYSQFPNVMSGSASLLSGNFQETKDALQPLVAYCEERDVGEVLIIAYLFLGPALVASGHMSQGLTMLEKARQICLQNQRRPVYCQAEYVLGYVYSQIATGPTPTLSTMARNVGFLVKNVPFAGKKAEEHFNKAIEVAREVGAKGILGSAYLGLGLLHKGRKRSDQARQCLREAIKIFEECEAEVYLAQAEEALASLG